MEYEFSMLTAFRVIALQQRVVGQTDKVINMGLPHLRWRALKLVRTPLNVYFTVFKSIFLSLYAPITSEECHAWFHLNAASQAARNAEQVNITKNSCSR